MSNNISTYAPVLIPTLCRSECFISCLTSLSQCIGAEYTEVYVALDYPLKDDHWEGYNKILYYLENSIFSFKKLHIIKREYNHGLANPNSNASVAYRELLKKYDRIIFSEDDNVFSPNFLVYVNKGLDKFEDDFSVDSICGYLNYNGIKTERNTFYRCPNAYCAWGVATWKNRILYRNKMNTAYFRKSLSINNLIKMGRMGRSRFLAYLAAMAPAKFFWKNDVNIGTYMLLENRCQILPTKSLVRNIGASSGLNFSNCSQEISDLYLKQEISSEETFDFIGTGNECQEENVKDWVRNEKEFHQKYHWITWGVVVTQTVKRIVKIIMGDLGWKPK